MSDNSSKPRSDELIQKIDDLLESDDLSTRTGLRLAFSALRDAISLMSNVGIQINEMDKKVITMWNGYRIVLCRSA